MDRKNSIIYKIIYDRFMQEGHDQTYPDFDLAKATEEHDIILEQYDRLKEDRYFDFSAFIEVAFEWEDEEE